MTTPTASVRRLSIDDLLVRRADLTVTLHPVAVSRDRIYGALLRRASSLAAAYAGPKTLGTTALAVIERTDEVDAGVNDAGEAIVVLRGVPGDLAIDQVVDERGRPVWRSVVGDLRHTFVEYQASREGDSSREGDAALFVLPERVWIIASGDARARAREVLVDATRVGPASFVEGDPGLAVLTIGGPALVRRDGRLRSGPLAALGRSLVRASFELTPGVQGVLVARLDYGDELAAAGAEQTSRDVVTAFRRSLERMEGAAADGSRPDATHQTAGAKTRAEPPPLSWLAAAGIERAGREVTVRAPIPRAWLEAIARADVADGSAGARKDDVPWDLWRRKAPAPALSLPDSSTDPSEP